MVYWFPQQQFWVGAALIISKWGGAVKLQTAWVELTKYKSVEMGGKGSKAVRKTAGEPHRGVLAATLDGHKDSVLCCTFSSDGRYLASCSADKTLIIWELRNMKPLHHIKGHKSEVNAVSFSPDSTTLLSCSRDCKVNLWDVKKGERLFSTHLSTYGPLMHCAFALDNNKMFATASERECIAIWEIQAHKVKKRILEGHSGIVFQVCFSPDNIQVASCGNDKRIILWNRSSGKVVAKLKDKYSAILTCQYNHDGTLIAGVVDGERVRIWNVLTNEIAFVLEGHHLSPVLSCAFSPDGGILATVSGDKTYALWDISDPHSPPVYHAKAHDNWIQTVAFSHDGVYLVTGSNDHKIHLWI